MGRSRLRDVLADGEAALEPRGCLGFSGVLHEREGCIREARGVCMGRGTYGALAQFCAEMKEEERELRAIAAERQARWIAGALGVRS